MEKITKLDLNDLEKVSGGAMDPQGEFNPDKYQEFMSAWNCLMSPDTTLDATSKYEEWAASGFLASSYDYILPFTK